MLAIGQVGDMRQELPRTLRKSMKASGEFSERVHMRRIGGKSAHFSESADRDFVLDFRRHAFPSIETYIFEVNRLAVDASRRRSNPVRKFSRLQHLSHQRLHILMILCRRQ